jgi:tripartite-type tricarboxylate transporter receptor subunit TctC
MKKLLSLLLLVMLPVAAWAREPVKPINVYIGFAPGSGNEVSYRGPAQAVTAVASHEVDFGIVPVAIANTLAQSGRVRILGLFSEQKLSQIPTVPLMQQYIPGASVYAAWGIILPKNTPADVVDWYVKNFANVIKGTEAQQFFSNNLMFSVDAELTPAGFKNSMSQLRKQ